MSHPVQLPGFLAALAPLLDHWGYLAVVFLILVEDFGGPAPGETVLIAASVYAGAGRLNIVAVGVVGFVAAVLGDNIGYAIGRFGGRTLVLRFGRYVRLTEERLARAESCFARHGGKIVIVARFIEGLRQANGIIAGITRMHWLRFVASTPWAQPCGWPPGPRSATWPETISRPSIPRPVGTPSTCWPSPGWPSSC